MPWRDAPLTSPTLTLNAKHTSSLILGQIVIFRRIHSSTIRLQCLLRGKIYRETRRSALHSYSIINLKLASSPIIVPLRLNKVSSFTIGLMIQPSIIYSIARPSRVTSFIIRWQRSSVRSSGETPVLKYVTTISNGWPTAAILDGYVFGDVTPLAFECRSTTTIVRNIVERDDKSPGVIPATCI